MKPAYYLLFFLGIGSSLFGQINLLQNGNFQTQNVGWNTTGNVFYGNLNLPNCNSCPGYAYTASTFNGNVGNNYSGQLTQIINIPSSTTSATFNFYRQITTNEVTTTIAYDFCFVQILDASTNTILWSRSPVLSNLDKTTGYVNEAYSLPPSVYGKTVKVQISVYSDNAKPTTFNFDDISLNVTTSCITWLNGIHPSDPIVDSAMEALCSYGIIPSNQSAVNGQITKLEVAKFLGTALLGNNNLAFLDNFPNLYPAVESLSSLADQRAIKLMLYLEYKDKGFPPSGKSDDISPFPREYFYGSYYSSVNKSDAIKAILETWDLAPSMFNYNPAGTTFSPLICDMPVSNRNLGWVERAQVLGYLTNNITSPCSSQGVNFGPDNAMLYFEFYVILARQLNINRPTVNYSDFFKPNIFYTNNLDKQSGVEKWIFHEYSDNGFNIPSGGISLQFQHSYHSNLTEIPILDGDQDPYEKVYLKPKVQPLGGGWTHSYSTFIKILDNNGQPPQKILIYWPDGTIHSFLPQQNKYENKGITDKLFIDSVNTFGHPTKIRIQKGRTVFTFRNIDNVGYRVLSLVNITDAHNNTLILDYILGYGTQVGFQPMVLSKVTDNFSNRYLTFSYWPGTNYLYSVTDPANRVLKFYVNPYTHDLDSSADAKNQITKYLYSVNPGTYAYRTHLLVNIQKPNGNNVSNSYSNRKLNQTQNANYLTTISPTTPDYSSPWSQQSVQVKTIQNNQTLVSNHTFNSNGDLATASNGSDSIQVEYDSENRPIKIRDLQRGFISKYDYDTNGFLKRVVNVDSLYNDSSRIDYINNPYGEVVNLKDYNDRANTQFHETNFYRNSEGNPTTIVENEGLGGEVQYNYGYQNGLLNNYYIAPFHDPYQINYNSFGNPTSISHCTQNFNCITAITTYDNISRPVTKIDFEGNSTSIAYDPNDNPTTVTKDSTGLNLQTHYGYDANDNLTSITSPKGHVTTLLHDFGSDDLIEENDGTNKKRWRYNEDGSLDSFINKNSTAFKYLYYNQSLFPNTQLNGFLYSDGTAFYQYEDVTKNLKRVNNSLGKENFFDFPSNHRGKWNKPGMVHTNGFFIGSNDYVVYEYDRMLRPTLIAYAGYGGKGYSYSHFYDFTTKNLWFVQDNSSFKTYVTYSYQKDGKPLTQVYSNGDTIFHHYDDFNREDSIWAINKSNQLLYSIGASLDKNGKHIQENLKILYQGVEVGTLPPLPVGQVKGYTYENRNRIITGDGKAYTSDGAGQVSNSTNPTITYTWSNNGLLTNVDRNGTQTIYDYDPLGNRKRKDNIYYVVDQQNTGNVVMEADQYTTPISVYIYGNGLICRIDPISDSLFYYHYDFRGNVIAITNEDGVMVQYYKYDPFGKVYDKNGSLAWNNSFQYLGRHGVQTDDSDLYYMKARYYQPSTGRFISEDPVWNTNLFPYADNDPINKVDPKGNSWIGTLKNNNFYLSLSGFFLKYSGIKGSLGSNGKFYKSGWGVNGSTATAKISAIGKSISGGASLLTLGSDAYGLYLYGTNPNDPDAVSPEKAAGDASVEGVAFLGPPGEITALIYSGLDKWYPGGSQGYNRDINGLLDKGYNKLYNLFITH